MKKVLYAILILILGYIIGCIIPVPFLMPGIQRSNSVVTPYESASLWINGILAFFTFLAVAVALFRDELIGLWKKVKLEIRPNSPTVLEEVLNEESGSSKANQYKIDLVVWNKGSIDARNCVVRLRNIRHENAQSQVETDLHIHEPRLNWISTEGNVITPEGSLLFCGLRIENLNREKENDSAVESPVLYIGENPIAPEYWIGKITVEFMVSCENRKSQRAFIEVQWDGVWKDRLADIGRHLKVRGPSGSEGRK